MEDGDNGSRLACTGDGICQNSQLVILSLIEEDDDDDDDDGSCPTLMPCTWERSSVRLVGKHLQPHRTGLLYNTRC